MSTDFNEKMQKLDLDDLDKVTGGKKTENIILDSRVDKKDEETNGRVTNSTSTTGKTNRPALFKA